MPAADDRGERRPRIVTLSTVIAADRMPILRTRRISLMLRR
jgi:hypothetical protein